MNEVVAHLESMEVLIKSIAEESELSSKEDIKASTAELVLLIVLGVILSIIFSYVIVLSITKPIAKAVELTKSYNFV